MNRLLTWYAPLLLMALVTVLCGLFFAEPVTVLVGFAVGIVVALVMWDEGRG